MLGLPLIGFGAVCGRRRLPRVGREPGGARLGKPMPRSVMPWILAIMITAVAIVAAVVLLVSVLR